MVFCIDTYRTWIEVADDNLYKEHVISRNTRTDFLVTRSHLPCGKTRTARARYSSPSRQKALPLSIPENARMRQPERTTM